jgi:hypothetical protein
LKPIKKVYGVKMKKLFAVISIAAVLAFGGILARGAGPEGKAFACGVASIARTYHSANITRWNVQYAAYNHIGLDIQAWTNSCAQNGVGIYYRVSTWRISGPTYYLFATLKVRAWNCNIYLGQWTSSSSGFNLAWAVLTPDVTADCLFQADDYQTSLYSSGLTPAPGQAAVSFGAYLNINQL